MNLMQDGLTHYTDQPRATLDDSVAGSDARDDNSSTDCHIYKTTIKKRVYL